MSRDIRSFFTVISKKSGTDSAKNTSLATKKKPKKLVDSDDEDVIPSTPESKVQKRPEKKKAPALNIEGGTSKKRKKSPEQPKKIEILSSDSEDDALKKQRKKSPEKPKRIEILSSDSEDDGFKKQPEKKEEKLKPVSVADVFKNTPIMQSKVDFANVQKEEAMVKEVKKNKRKSKKNGKDAEKKVHNDTDFEKTLEDLDDDFIESNAEQLEKVLSELQKENVSELENTRKRSNTESPDKSTPKKRKIEHVDSGIDPGQEAHEKKRYSAMLYQKYLNRSGPKHHGLKELPKGKPNCLNNLCFLRTGVLDSLDSEEFDKLIKEHGGRIVHSVSKKVDYLVVGDDPGPVKLAKAESLKIKTISEDELLDLILTKSGMEAKYTKKNHPDNIEDLGIEVDQDIEIEEIHKEQKLQPEIKSVKLHANDQPSTSKIKQEPKFSPPPPPPKQDPSLMLPLTEKYKPQSLSAIIGQQGQGSNVNRLKNWLERWHKNQQPETKKKIPRPSPWAKNDDGAYFKCALLSGSPGVGKTTTATLVAKAVGLDIVEFNASDTRSKKSLKEEVAQLLHNKTIAGYATGQTKVANNRVLLMDEVDGMAGNEDRGGIQELIQLIKTSSVPIICMCNDRNHQKMRSLVNYCFDLRFPKPRLDQIKAAMLTICSKENIDISPQALEEIIAATGCDIRQTFNHISILGSSNHKITAEMAGKEAKSAKKDTIMGPWEVCRTVFTKSQHKNMSVADKARLFFFDYSIGPLFVQENYLKVQPEGGGPKQSLLKAALAAGSLSTGDIIDCKIRKSNNWSLLESQAFFSSVLPGHYMSGNFTKQIDFPNWLGKNSKRNKFARLTSDIQKHTLTSTSAGKMAIRMDYLSPLMNAITTPLREKGLGGVQEAVTFMKDYSLLREDVDSLVELNTWSGDANPMSGVDSKVKAAFTRAYNKQVTLLPYAPLSGVAKKKAVAADDADEEEVISDHEDDDDITDNSMIKVKEKAADKGKKTKDGAGTSKKSESKKPSARKRK